MEHNYLWNIYLFSWLLLCRINYKNIDIYLTINFKALTIWKVTLLRALQQQQQKISTSKTSSVIKLNINNGLICCLQINCFVSIQGYCSVALTLMSPAPVFNKNKFNLLILTTIQLNIFSRSYFLME